MALAWPGVLESQSHPGQAKAGAFRPSRAMHSPNSAGSIMQTKVLDLLGVLVPAILAACHLADGLYGN